MHRLLDSCRSNLLASVALLALLLGAFVSAPAVAQDAGFRITVRPGDRDYPIALPEPVTDRKVKADDAAALWEVIKRDLALTGYFEIIDPAAYLDTSGQVEPGTFSMATWRQIDAVALAKTRMAVREDGSYSADVYVYDVGADAKVVAKRFVGRPEDIRYLGHKIADEILMALTGQPGFFGARIAAVGSKTGNKEIYVMDIDGKGVHAVTRNGSINLSPAWSPDGGSIAWTSYKRGNMDLYSKELSTGRTRVLSNQAGMNSGAAYSPDGTQVALARSTAGDSDIYVLEAATGKTLSRVTRGGGIDVAPDFSPDGTKLAFSSERSGGQQIFIADLATGETKRLTFSGDFNFDPVWSPDGTRLAFVGRSMGFNIFVINADGTGLARVTQDQGNNEDPCWSPDGRYLLFSSNRRGREEIWLSTPDGRHQAPVTDGHGGWTQPRWAPSSKP